MKYKSRKEAEIAALQSISDYCWSHDEETGLNPITLDEEFIARVKEINEALEYYKEDV